MQTTLRIHDAIYREAKAQAARAGMSLTKYIEEALRQKIEGAGATLRETTPAYEATGSSSSSPSNRALSDTDSVAMSRVLQEFEDEEEGAEEAWADEIAARIELVRNGKAKSRPLEEFMQKLAKQVLTGNRASLKLRRFSKEERSDLALRLLDFESEEEGSEEAWADEIKARIQSIDDGTAVEISWEEVQRKADKLLGK